MTLQDELAGLAALQPVQPADRLAAVTARARRIRRNRALVAAAAVVAIVAPVGAVLASDPQARPVDQVASPRTWPDRSPGGNEQLAAGAVLQWATETQRVVSEPKWLYRGDVDVPGGERLYVVAFITDGRIVLGSGRPSGMTPDGRPLPGEGSHWDLDDTPVDQAPPFLSLYLQRIGGAAVDDNWLFVLGPPGARTLRWTSTPLAFAPTGPDIVDHGSLTSSDGVFQGWTGAVTGRLTATTAGRTASLSFPDAELTLARVPDPPQGGTTTGISGGTGQLDDSHPTTSAVNASTPTPPSRVRIRCYGGGSITLLAGERVAGSAPCDLSLHAVSLPALAKDEPLTLRGDRFQVYAFAHDRL
jgi:hypothetical protein